MKNKTYKIEVHKLRKTDRDYQVIYETAKKTKSLYNYANFLFKQNFLFNNAVDEFNRPLLNKEGKTMPKMLSAFGVRATMSNANTPCFRALNSDVAESVLAVVHQNWKSYVKSIKDYSKNPSKYLGKPKMPKYLKENEIFQVVKRRPSQRNGVITMPASLNNMTIKETGRYKGYVCKQVRFIPASYGFKVELVYELPKENTKEKINYSKVAGVDLGLKNLLTAVTTGNDKPFIVSGNPLISKNSFYNMRIDEHKSVLEKTRKAKTSKFSETMWDKRYNYIHTYLHKASTDLVKWCVDNNVTHVVLGHNKNQKQESKLKNFVQIPIMSIIPLIEYKLEAEGITMETVEESYTSGTSFLDNEKPTKEHYENKRRISRGEFVSNDGTKINADVNAAYQIIKKSKNKDITFDLVNIENIFTPKKVSYC